MPMLTPMPTSMPVLLTETEKGGTACFVSGLKSTSTDHKLTLPIWATFEFKDLLYHEKSPHMVTGYPSIYPFYGAGNNEMSLLLLETMFFVSCIPKDTEKVMIVYIGAHPGDHLNHLIGWFPSFRFEFYNYLGIKPDIAMRKIKAIDNRSIKHEEYFNDKLAADYKTLAEKDGWNIYFISNIRDNSYRKGDTKSGEYIDSDMLKQLKWASIMEPKFALMRYRPKLKDERTIVPPYLTDQDDGEITRKQYYMYPEGYFFKIPIPKRNAQSMFIVTNTYEGTKKYYHTDMLSMIDHHNLNVRRAHMYINPNTMTYSGFFGEDVVRQFAAARGINTNGREKAFSCGLDWSHRAMVFIIRQYMRYRGISLKDEYMQQLILIPYLEMELELESE